MSLTTPLAGTSAFCPSRRKVIGCCANLLSHGQAQRAAPIHFPENLYYEMYEKQQIKAVAP